MRERWKVDGDSVPDPRDLESRVNPTNGSRDSAGIARNQTGHFIRCDLVQSAKRHQRPGIYTFSTGQIHEVAERLGRCGNQAGDGRIVT